MIEINVEFDRVDNILGSIREDITITQRGKCIQCHRSFLAEIIHPNARVYLEQKGVGDFVTARMEIYPTETPFEIIQCEVCHYAEA